MSGYFNKFPLIRYKSQNTDKVARNILSRGAIRETLKTNDTSFQTYQIQEGDRADNLSSFLFSRPDMDYMFYLINDITDPYYDWYLSQDQLIPLIFEKYGDERLDPHHYEGYNSKELGIVSISTIRTLSEFKDITNIDDREQYLNYIRIEITIDTYDLLSDNDKLKYTAISNEVFQQKENEKRKFINVVIPSDGFELDRQLKQALKN